MFGVVYHILGNFQVVKFSKIAGSNQLEKINSKTSSCEALTNLRFQYNSKNIIICKTIFENNTIQKLLDIQ